MRKGLAILLILIIAGSSILIFNLDNVKAMAPPAVQWNKMSSGRGYSITQTTDGGYAIGGFNAYNELLLTKSDSSGTNAWAKTYQLNASMTNPSLVNTNDGGYALAYGYNVLMHLNVGVLKKTDSLGNEVWNYTLSGIYFQSKGIVQSTDGDLVWLGHDGSIPTPDHLVSERYIWLGKFDSLGNKLWSKTFGNESYASSLFATSDGGYLIAGSASGNGLLIKTDSNGNQVWNKTYSKLIFSSVIQTVDAGYALAGGTMLVKTDSYGALQWNQTLGFTATSLVQTNDGGYALICGNFLVKTDSLGNLQWSKDVGSTIASFIKTNDGGYAVVYGNSFSLYECYLMKIAPSFPPQLPFADRFSNLDKWTIVNGTWVLISDGVQGTGSTSAEALMYAGSNSWVDYQISVVVTVPAGQFAGVVFRYVDSNNYYWAGIGDWGNQYSISKVVDGAYSEIIGSGTATSNGAGTYILKVIVQGSIITLYVNDNLFLTSTDSTFASGAIGLRTFDSTTIEVNSVSVSVPTPPPTPSTSPTVIPTPSVSPSPTLTASPSPTPTTSPTPIPSPSTTPSPTPTPTPTPSPTPTSTTSPSVNPTTNPTASPTATPTSSPIASQIPIPAPSQTPTTRPTATIQTTATTEATVSVSLFLYIIAALVAVTTVTVVAVVFNRRKMK